MLPAVRWLDEHLAAEGRSAEELVQLEILSQGSANLMARNIITSMRLLSAFDWKIFFESVSLVDEVLRAGSNFGEMDFRTRDMYRHAIEELARGSRSSELYVARAALQRAKEPGHLEGAAPTLDERLKDPGYYLISGGRPAFERELRFRASPGRRISRVYVAAANPGYVVTVMLLTAVILVPLLLQAGGAGAGALIVLLLELVLFFPASDLAVAVMNRVVTELIGPRPLPKLELREGVPANLRTMVVVPTILASPARDPGADRTARGALFGEPGRGDPFRNPLRLAGRRERASPGRWGAAGGSGVRDPAPERYPWGAARRQPALLPVPSPATLERRGAEMDGMGTEAWKAPRAESLAERRVGYHVSRRWWRTATRARERPLCDHTRCRYAPAAPGRLPIGQRNGASAQPASLRSRNWKRHRRLWRPPATGHAVATDGRRDVAVPAHLLGAGRHRSLRGRGLGRLPGPLPRRLLRGKGDLRHRCLRGLTLRTRSRECAAESRSLRRVVRPSRTRERHRALRGVS